MTGGYLKGRIRREDIITAAAAAYGELGYHGSSLREIAKRVGISHAGLLYYFPTKEALLAAVLERRDAEDSEREQLTVPPGLEVLRHFVALAEHNVRHPGIVDLYSRLAAEAVSRIIRRTSTSCATTRPRATACTSRSRFWPPAVSCGTASTPAWRR